MIWWPRTLLLCDSQHTGEIFPILAVSKAAVVISAEAEAPGNTMYLVTLHIARPSVIMVCTSFFRVPVSTSMNYRVSCFPLSSVAVFRTDILFFQVYL